MYSRPLLSLNKIFSDLRRFEIVCGGERGRCTQVIEAYRYSYFHIFRTGPTENNISIVSIDQTTFLKITCKESSAEDMYATNFIFILFFHILVCLRKAVINWLVCCTWSSRGDQPSHNNCACRSKWQPEMTFMYNIAYHYSKLSFMLDAGLSVVNCFPCLWPQTTPFNVKGSLKTLAPIFKVLLLPFLFDAW